MSAPNDNSTTPTPQPEQKPMQERIVDPRELVYTGRANREVREMIEDPAVTPEMLETAPEDLRDDLMPKNKEEDDK